MYPVVKPYVVQELPLSVLSRPNPWVGDVSNQPSTTSDDLITEKLNDVPGPSRNATSSCSATMPAPWRSGPGPDGFAAGTSS